MTGVTGILGLVVETVSRHMTAFQQDGLIALSGLRGVRLRFDGERMLGHASTLSGPTGNVRAAKATS